MTEHDATSREYIAKKAMRDYMSVGPGVGFGELEVAALDEWLHDARAAWVSPLHMANVAWMHVERVWSRVTEARECSGGTLSADVVKASRDDFAQANTLFRHVTQSGDERLRIHTGVSAMAVPKFDFALLGSQTEVLDYTSAENHKIIQAVALRERLENFKRHGQPQDVLAMDVALGQAVFTLAFEDTRFVPLPSAYRHFAGAGSHYDYWHAALYDRENGATYKMRVAPNGPPDFIVIPPELFHNEGFPSKHGLGTFEAFVLTNNWYAAKKAKHERPEALTERAMAHVDSVGSGVGHHIEKQVWTVLDELQPEIHIPSDLSEWYQALSPFEDPCHASWKGALELGMSELELKKATEGLSLDEQYMLAWMYMESALSFEARASGNSETLALGFDRAEDLLQEVIGSLPAGSSDSYEAALALAAASTYKSLVIDEETDVHIEAYAMRVGELAHEMLQSYEAIRNKSSLEAIALATLSHHVTAYLAITATPDRSNVALPAAPRQRGGNGVPRGWDFSVWVQQGNGEFIPGVFAGRIEDMDDVHSLHNGVITISKKALGQGPLKYNFRTLRTILAELLPGSQQKKHLNYKALAQARTSLGHITNANG